MCACLSVCLPVSQVALISVLNLSGWVWVERGLIWCWVWVMCTHSINARKFHWTFTAAWVSKIARWPSEYGSVRNDPLTDPVHHSPNFTFQKEKGLTQTVTLPLQRKRSFITGQAFSLTFVYWLLTIGNGLPSAPYSAPKDRVSTNVLTDLLAWRGVLN